MVILYTFLLIYGGLGFWSWGLGLGFCGLFSVDEVSGLLGLLGLGLST